jgi:transposase
METKCNKIDFTNQIIFIGIDVHKKNWSVTLSTNKIILKTFSMDPSAQQLANYLRKNYPGGKYKSVYEAGFCGFGVHKQLEALGIENIIVNPADIPTKNKEKRNRNDHIDSRKLARELENGTLTGIYIPTEEQQELRSMNRLRYQLVKDQARMKNRIKGFLLFYGKRIPENYEMVNWSGNFIKYLEELDFNSSIGKETLQEYLTELKEKKLRISKIIKSLRSSVKEYGSEEIIKKLCSIPGIGFLSAVTLLVELIDINRFKKTDELCSYVGLIPSVDSSGQKEKVLGLNGRHNKYLRNLLLESAWVAVRKDPALTLQFNKLSSRMSKQKAIIRIAKKLLCRIHFVWKNNKSYEIGIV